MRKQAILKLNKNFYPLGIFHWQSVMIDIISGAVHPVDVYYDTDDNGKVNMHKIASFNVVRDFKEWAELPIREYDECVHTPSTKYRLPPIAVCAKFDSIKIKTGQFPTKANISRRDNNICQYTGNTLTKEQISIDHILPSSRGGENTWENLVTCDRALNTWKGDRTPKECGLKLIKPPRKPNNGMVFDYLRTEWEIFLGGGSYNDTW